MYITHNMSILRIYVLCMYLTVCITLNKLYYLFTMSVLYFNVVLSETQLQNRLHC